MSKQKENAVETRLNAIADAWAPAVKAACASTPSAAVLGRIHKQALQELEANRRRRFFVRLRPVLVSAAAAAVVCTVTLFALRPAHSPSPKGVLLKPAAALHGILLLAETAASDSDLTGNLQEKGIDTESLALRLLQVQGFVDSESEILLSYL